MIQVFVNGVDEVWLNPKHIVSVEIEVDVVRVTTRRNEWGFDPKWCQALLVWLAMNKSN